MTSIIAELLIDNPLEKLTGKFPMPSTSSCRASSYGSVKVSPLFGRFYPSMLAQLEKLAEDAVRDVFATMLCLEVAKEPPHTLIRNGEPRIAGSVGFVGELSGVVYIYSTCSFARLLTGRLLHLAEPDAHGDEMVNDAVGEIANMIVGNLKSRLSDRGMPCVLSIPSIIRGDHLTIEPVRSTERCLLTFQCHPDNQLVVEILIKPNP